MKKILSSSVALLAFFSIAFSQKPRIGFTAGIAVANQSAKVDGATYSINSTTGFTAGLLLDIPVNEHFSFQPSLNFVQKGARQNDFGDIYTLKLNYIEVPLNFLYNTRAANGNFFIGAGPSLAFGISGKEKMSSNGQIETTKIKFGSGIESDLRALDLGANILAGYEFKKGFSIAANYNLGLSNLFPGGSEDGKLHNKYFGIKLGYMLGKK